MRLVSISFFGLLVFIIIIRYFFSLPTYTEGQRIRVSSTVYTEPNVYDTALGLELAGLRVYLPRYPEVEYWDQVVVEGIVQGGQLKDPKLISQTKSQLIVIKIRKSLIAFINSVLPQPHASLMSGIILGSKASIPEDFWDKLTKTSTAHVVVASGMNVTMLAAFLLNLLILFMSRKKAVCLAIGGVWVYSFFSGFDAPIVRASIMGTIAFSAQALGRLSNALYALFLSAGLMLVVNPLWLVNLGFILSFVATLSLILFQAKVDGKLHFVPAFLREGLSTSLAAQIGVAPILFLAFGQINLLSPLINALILWTVPYIMIIGSLGSIIGLVIEPIGRILLYLALPLCWWFVGIVDIFNF